MPSKRTHAKSRLGCKQCKQRRIKCDQKPPSCGHCTRKGIECDYKELGEHVNTDMQVLTPEDFARNKPKKSPAAYTPPPGASSSSSATAARSSATFSVDELGLLHFYTLYTAPTIGVIENEAYQFIWQHDVPLLAQSHPFLMHAILGFAAAHQQWSAAAQGAVDLTVSRRHYSKALATFRDAVKGPKESAADAIFCFSILVCFLSLALESGAEPDPIMELTNLLHLLHHSVGLLNSLDEPIRRSRVSGLWRHKDAIPRHSPAPDVDFALRKLDTLIAAYIQPTADPGDLEMLCDANRRLRHLYCLTTTHPDSWAHLLSWLIAGGPQFAAAVKTKQQFALLLVAHWCVPACNAPEKWWVRGWPQRMMLSIAEQLQGTIWETGLEWPLANVSLFGSSSVTSPQSSEGPIGLSNWFDWDASAC